MGRKGAFTFFTLACNAVIVRFRVEQRPSLSITMEAEADLRAVYSALSNRIDPS